MKKKQFLGALLLAATLLTSCGGASDSGASAETPDVSAVETTAAETTAEETSYLSTLTGIDYGGYTFTIIDRSPESNPFWYACDVWAEAENGDPINDAIYARNLAVAEALNVNIAEYNEKKKPVEILKKSVQAGEDAYDAVSDGLSSLASAAVSGYLADLGTMDGLDLSHDWWDQEIVSGFTIGGHVYLITGDIQIMDDRGTWGILFNKPMRETLLLDDPYGLVNDGRWTLDAMQTMAQAALADLDGDGTIVPNKDRLGLGSEAYNMYAFWACGGEKVAGKDENALPVLTLYTERGASALDKIITLNTGDWEADSESFNNGDAEAVDKRFAEGYILFIYGGLRSLSEFRASEVTFGILPAPKFDEAQDRYHTTYSINNCCVMAVPMTTGDPERTGTVLEALAAASADTLSPAYYDVCLSGKYLRDDESEAMLDLLLSTRNFDIGIVFNWGETLNIFYGMYDSKQNTLSSDYAAKEGAIRKDMENFVKAITG